MRDPQIVSLLSLIKAILSLIDSYISLLSLIEAIFQRVSKWGSLSFPMIEASMMYVAWSVYHAVDAVQLMASMGNFFTKNFPTKNSWGKFSWGFPRN